MMDRSLFSLPIDFRAARSQVEPGCGRVLHDDGAFAYASRQRLAPSSLAAVCHPCDAGLPPVDRQEHRGFGPVLFSIKPLISTKTGSGQTQGKHSKGTRSL